MQFIKIHVGDLYQNFLIYADSDTVLKVFKQIILVLYKVIAIIILYAKFLMCTQQPMLHAAER